MDLQSLLAAILNPNGTQQAAPMGVPQVGDHNNPNALRAQQPQTAQPMAFAPQQAPQAQPMPQGAPQAAPASNGGSLGILGDIFAPKASARNRTVGWLQSQGLDPGTATVLASDKGALRSYILARSQGQKPIEINGRLVDPNTYQVLADFSEKKAREIRNDANGTPRYVDTGQPVYPGDQNTGKEMFTGKSVDAQGLNYLISQGLLTKEQAANVAAGKTVTGPNGEIIFMTPQGLYQQPANGGPSQPVGEPQQAPQQGGNIPVTGPKYSEDMRKAGGFAVRAQEADKIVSQPNVTAAGSSMGQNAMAGAPFGLGNYLVSNDYQQFDQAQRDFINAVLRRESGAAISESEFQNARQQYFPQPGDGEDVIKQKAANRQLAVQSLYQSADPVPAMTGPAQRTTTPGANGPQSAPKKAPTVGETRYGYRFKGGDPSEPSNWEKAN
ncbi:hypothetical protein [Mesorhizobium sp. M4B.F.Ca.ET.143.01.1.1]|uniref:hypothetical protein n=1 Tax=Mesorhizobium sp. M4B.F.Ca.ET.143.01.1.1 TaxID=2563947 RepID=UPI00109356C4|nr:hypothetical protein [Mesorhizobium sp. M4B.F.Ca.ET.143.01.1.1]TGV26332.1 hypothetical protein EN786_12470 [Mesorhizobium sp. M4B.F.Ca.ET.143.01.1.1]